jgi:spore germination protein PD
MKKVKLKVVNNGDLQVAAFKINSISSSAVVLLGDAERITPRSVSISRGVRPVASVVPSTTGPVGSA